MRVGLTGSIAVGKSYVASVFAELGCTVIDADVVARVVVEPGTTGLRAVVTAFGEEVVRSDGGLDRQKLGAIIFGDAERRALLNSILHPLIIAAQDEQIRAAEDLNRAGVIIVDAALMIESGSYQRFEKLIVVHCREKVQLDRLMRRENLTEAEALQRVRAQMPQAEKKRYADFLIDTSDGFDDARRQTVAAYEQLKKLAAR